jgi:methyl-accepting chemotaxis protein
MVSIPSQLQPTSNAAFSGDVEASIEAIAGMARDNTGTVEQTAGAAHDLKRLADGLAAIVGRFKV